MKEKRVFLLCGVPGSGKSTWAQERIAYYGGYHISRDKIRFAILDERGGDYFAHENEVINTFYKDINELLDSDEEYIDIYIDATHLTKASRSKVLKKLHLKNAYVIAVGFDIPIEICKYRNKLRTGLAVVPDKTIEEMYNRMQQPSIFDFDEVWTVNVDGVLYEKKGDEI